MNAKTIIIESVQNGWIVRPWNGGCWDPGREVEVYVYRTIEDIQKDLPKLLNHECENSSSSQTVCFNH